LKQFTIPPNKYYSFQVIADHHRQRLEKTKHSLLINQSFSNHQLSSASKHTSQQTAFTNNEREQHQPRSYNCKPPK